MKPTEMVVLDHELVEPCVHLRAMGLPDMPMGRLILQAVQVAGEETPRPMAVNCCQQCLGRAIALYGQLSGEPMYPGVGDGR